MYCVIFIFKLWVSIFILVDLLYKIFFIICKDWYIINYRVNILINIEIVR